MSTYLEDEIMPTTLKRAGAVDYGPISQAEVDACRDRQGDLIIMIPPGPCPSHLINRSQFLATQALSFSTSGFTDLS